MELLNLIKQGRVDVIVTTEILAEYKRSVFSFSEDEALATEWRAYFREFGIFVEATQKFTLCRDPDDNKFLNAAYAGKADFIISGDKDLREMTGFHIPVVTVSVFLAELKMKGV